MITVNVNTLKAKLSEYLNLAIEKRETITVVNRNIPVAEIKAIKQKSKTQRKLGLYKEDIYISEDFNKFDAEVEELFYGGKL